MTNKEKVLACSIGIFGIATITIGALTRIEQKNYESNKSNFQRIQTVQSVLTTVDSSEIKDYTLSSRSVDNLSSGSINEMSFVSNNDNDYSYKRYLRCDPAPTNNSVNDNSVKPEDICRISVGESMPIPDGLTNCYMYMDYRTLTDYSSRQYQLQYDGNAWIDNDGFRRYNTYYMVAMGSVYGDIGDTLRVWTDEGNVYDVIIGDIKGTDAIYYDYYDSWYHVCGDSRKNVVEFIVQTEYLPSEVILHGDCGVLENIGGNVVRIERLP